MPSTPERLTDYLESVSGEIRWPRARRLLLRELRDHIDDQSREFQKSSLNDDESLARAVSDMGDPVEVGRDLNRLHRPRNAWGIVILVLLVAGFGLFVSRIGPIDDFDYNFSRQFAGIVVGAAAMVGLWFSDYTLLLRKTCLCAVGFFLVLILCGPILTNYSVAGVSVRGLIYPLLFTPVLFAALLCKLKERKHIVVLLCGLLALLLAVIPSFLPSMVTTIYISLSMLSLLVYAVWSGWFSVSKGWGTLCACAPMFPPVAAFFRSPYINVRLELFFHPERDPLGGGWLALTTQSILASLPFVNTSGIAVSGPYDVIFRSTDLFLLRLATRFGLVVLPAALLLTLFLIGLALWRFHRLRSRQGRFLALTALLVLAAEALGYILYNCGFVLLSPIAFPFLSYGVGALILNFCLLGLILSVIRMDSLVRDIQPKRTATPRPSSLTIHLPFHRGKIRIGYEKA